VKGDFRVQHGSPGIARIRRYGNLDNHAPQSPRACHFFPKGRDQVEDGCAGSSAPRLTGARQPVIAGA
jgi:hypothetical protein